jgi:raffinose/stachyose/melibiose transport system substrate-binding protein
MKRRQFTAGMLATGSAALASGFSAAPLRADEKVTLSFLHKWPEPDNSPFFQNAVAAFQAQHPNVTISMDAVADEPYKAKIRTVMASGEIPDIYFTWVGEFTRAFIRAGRVMDISRFLAAPEWQGRFAEATLNAYSDDGKLYGVPLNIDAKFMVYNKSLFTKAGITEAPADWPAFEAACNKLKSADIVPIAFGSQLAWATSHYVGDLNAKLVPEEVRVADYRLTAPADKLFTDAGYVQSLELYTSMLSKGWLNKTPNALTHAVARTNFRAGRAGMMYQELVEFGSAGGTKLEQDGWDFFPMPAIPGGRGRQDLLTGAPDGFVVWSGCKHPEIAMQFLSFLTSKPEGAEYTRITKRTSATIGAVTSANASPQTLRGMDAIAQAKGMVVWLDTDVEARVGSAYLAGAQAVLGGSDTPAQVMQKVRAAALEAKKENG